MADPSFAERYGPLAVVTGAAVGMGAAFARDLADRGLDLLLVDRDERALEACALELEAGGATVATLVVDLADRDAADVPREALEALGHAPSVIPGEANRQSHAFLSSLDRAEAIKTMGDVMRVTYPADRQPDPSV